MVKRIWAFGDEQLNRALAERLESSGSAVEFEVIHNADAAERITRGDEPDLIITGSLGGGGIPEDLITPPGNQIIKTVRAAGIRAPITLFTGDLGHYPISGRDGGDKYFPDQNVFVLHKVITEQEVVRHIRQQLGLARPDIKRGVE